MTADEAPDVDEVDAHSHLVESRLGRVVVGIATAVLAFWIVAPNMPASPFRVKVDALWTPANEIGLAQDWAVFSPNPRTESIDVRARITYADGSIEFWDVPDFDPFTGALRQYRWNKWQERIRLDDRAAEWPAAAEWIAELHARDGVLPASVVLIRRWIVHEPLGADGPATDSGWNEFEFFTWTREP